MSAKKNVALSVGKVLTYIFLLLAVVGVMGFFAFFTNGFTDNFKSFYVMCGEERIMSSINEGVYIPFDEVVQFDVKYTFGNFDKQKKGYSVKIVPNVTEETNFSFVVNGENHMFSDELDLTGAFDIVLNEDYFILTISKDMSMKEILSRVYNGQDVETDIHISENLYFVLAVSSYNDKAVIRIPLRFYIGVDGITIDKETIAIW